jgi:tripartite-type tricarboxylate transporter receptor subunit TctC
MKDPMKAPRMNRRDWLGAALAAGGAGLWPAAANAAPNYKSRPLTLVVPVGPGSSLDQIARALAPAIAAETGGTVMVDNKPGASGFIAAQQVARAPADGHMVFITSNSTHATNPHLFNKLPYDPVADFTPVTLLARSGQVLVVNPELPVRNVAELVALAKTRKLAYGSGGPTARIASELFASLAGVEMLHVPYKSPPAALTDLLGGQVQVMFSDLAASLSHVRAGKLRALGVTSRTRAPLAPELPTLAEAGLRDYELSFWFAAYLPKNAGDPLSGEVAGLLQRAMRHADARAFYDRSGFEPAESTPSQLVAFQASETARWGRLVKLAGIQPE